MDDIAGQAAQAERQAGPKIKQRSNNGYNAAEDQQGPSEFAEWIHEPSLKLLRFDVKARRRLCPGKLGL
jgi:hypothetical protein